MSSVSSLLPNAVSKDRLDTLFVFGFTYNKYHYDFEVKYSGHDRTTSSSDGLYRSSELILVEELPRMAPLKPS